MLLSLIVLGSSVAFNIIVSLSVVGLYSSYFLICSLLLWRRVTGAIKPSEEATILVGPGRLFWGPWRIPEPWGTLNDGFACLYLTLLLFWSFWPQTLPVVPSTMNFSSLVFVVTILCSIIWNVGRGRERFKGPVVEVDLAQV